MNLLEVGKIVRAHGIKGAVKVLGYLDEGLKMFNHVFIGENKQEAKILSISELSGGAYTIEFDIIKDMETALKYKNFSLYIDRDEYTEFKGKIYLSDLINAPVLSEKGEVLGRLIDFDDYGASVVLTINCGDVSYQLPYVEEIISYDEKKQAFVIDEQKFKDVRV